MFGPARFWLCSTGSRAHNAQFIFLNTILDVKVYIRNSPGTKEVKTKQSTSSVISITSALSSMIMCQQCETVVTLGSVNDDARGQFLEISITFTGCDSSCGSCCNGPNLLSLRRLSSFLALIQYDNTCVGRWDREQRATAVLSFYVLLTLFI